MTLKNDKKRTQSRKYSQFVLATISISLLVFSLNPAAAVLYYPQRADWEGHDSAKGTRSTLDITTPSLATGTNWWWAKTFALGMVVVDDPVKGAMGAGWASYIPLGSSTAVKQYIVYKYDVSAASQGYSFGGSTSGSITTPRVEYTSGGCWDRVVNGVTYNACVSGMTQGHAKYYTSRSHSGNTVPEQLNPNEYKTAGGSWQYFSQNQQPYYCHADYAIQKLSSGNKFLTSTMASGNSCTYGGSGLSDSNAIPG
ncbi:MAG: hypothetical protein CV087_20355 [Candidatus Brocadia sp. WS118]|nr:MAG: hypothetical protein CV087_20355 [Candidatus Brocadia sp. WS118]